MCGVERRQQLCSRGTRNVGTLTRNKGRDLKNVREKGNMVLMQTSHTNHFSQQLGN